MVLYQVHRHILSYKYVIRGWLEFLNFTRWISFPVDALLQVRLQQRNLPGISDTYASFRITSTAHRFRFILRHRIWRQRHWLSGNDFLNAGIGSQRNNSYLLQFKLTKFLLIATMCGRLLCSILLIYYGWVWVTRFELDVVEAQLCDKY